MSNPDELDRCMYDAAAYVLGALPPADLRAYGQHLQHCQRCAQEIRELAAMPALLARVPAEQAIATDRPQPGREANLRRRFAVAGWLAAAAACVVLIIVVACA